MGKPQNSTSCHNHVRFDVIKYQGSVSFLAQADARLVRLAYPFVSMENPDEESTSVYACNLDAGSEMYIGARGGTACAAFHTKDECSQEKNAVVSVKL